MRRQVGGLLLLLGAVAAPAAERVYGPVGDVETLSQVAQKFRPAPGGWVMICQTALAIYWANPQAFDGSIHRIRPGASLRVPDAATIRAVDVELARKLFREPDYPFPATAPAPGSTVAAESLAPAPAPVRAEAPSPAAARSEAAPPPPAPPLVPVPAAAIVPARVPLRPVPKPEAELESSPFKFSPQPGELRPSRRRPGAVAVVRRAEPEGLPDPNRASGLAPVALPPAPWDPESWEKAGVPDRWRLLNSLGLVPQRWYDPYNQNTWKGDKPVRKGDEFLTLTAIWDTVLEPRRLPTPVGAQASSRAGSVGIFGEGDQFTYNQNLILQLVYLKGDTTFRPPDWEYHLMPVLNYNYTQVDETRLLNVNPARGTTRSDEHVGIQELFADYHLRNVSDRYDFDSFRIGVQPFSVDFRGFLFQDNQLMARLFGTRDNNRWQYNLAYMRRLEKDTNSGLNDLGRRLREDDTVFANLYRQDFPVLGFTSQITLAHNRNREDRKFFDNNGVIARPASLGVEKSREYDVTYAGYNGDGHLGRLNLSVSLYVAAGDESRGMFLDRERDILAGFGAAEASVDFDWVRVRLSGLYATGDDDPFDEEANGFDAIFENPVFAGADTDFWNRQAVPLIGGGGVTLTTRNGLLNNLRTSKEHGQSNFDNPGVALAGLGFDFDLTPTLRLSNNFNHLWFAETAVLEVARNQDNIAHPIGTDLSAALIWRPFFQQNVVLRLSGAYLVPGAGFKDLFPDEEAYSVLGNIVLTY